MNWISFLLGFVVGIIIVELIIIWKKAGAVPEDPYLPEDAKNLDEVTKQVDEIEPEEVIEKQEELPVEEKLNMLEQGQ